MNSQYGFGLLMGTGLVLTAIGFAGMLGSFRAFKLTFFIGVTCLTGGFLYLRYAH